MSLTRLRTDYLYVDTMKKVTVRAPRAPRKAANAREVISSAQLSEVAAAYMGLNVQSDVQSLVRGKVTSYAGQDRRKGRETDLSVEGVLERMVAAKMLCHYCSCCLKVHYVDARDPQQWTLDRIDNDLGHTIENVLVCCLDCNVRRRTTDMAKFEFTKRLSLKKLPAPIEIYVDGSCASNARVRSTVCKAGWGVAVIDESRVTELFGPVLLDAQDRCFLGAEVGSNNTAELSAMCEALLYVASNVVPEREVVIRYDSMYAANVITGACKAHTNQALVSKGKTCLEQARAGNPVTFMHVKAHSGDKWNDLADALARRGCAGDRCGVGRWA